MIALRFLSIVFLTLSLSTPALAQDVSADSGQSEKKTRNKVELGNEGRFYASWGFNRGYHSKADMTFHTADGDFTIRNAHGNDRPSKNFSSYFLSTKAQYNFRFGHYISDRWALEIGTDHMKWVFDNTRNYEITGDYSRQVWVGGQLVDFDTVKQNQDARFINVEHTNGYNYGHVSAQYYFPIFISNNKKWVLLGAAGGGLGMFITKTRVEIWDQVQNEPRIRDNKFEIVGYGAHLEGKIRFGFKNFYLETASRHVLGEVTNAPFLGSEGSISQSIYSRQIMISAGAEFRFSKNGKKSKK